MKSAALGMFTLAAVLIFTFTLIFVWSGSAGIKYQRTAMKGDRDTAKVLKAYEDQFTKTKSRYADDELDQGMGDMRNSDSIGGGGPKTIVWINIPGFRGDYIERSSAAFLGEMAYEGTSTTKMRPNFPPVTYPGHITMATGVTPNIHGIPSDTFKVGDTIVNRPMDPSLLLAEPIWQTTTRQGKATLVHDWPLSQNQTGPNKATYFLTNFDEEATDQQRLDRLWDGWVGHQGDTKMRLLMCRLDDILKAGQENGPRAEETYEVVKKTDEVISNFITKVKAAWANLRSGNDGNLVIMITTDHGLAALDKNVNLAHLLGPELMENIDTATHDAVGHIYFKNLPESVAEANLLKDQIDAELKKRIYFRTYKQTDLPSNWKYTSTNGRIGDRVLVLKDGFGFSDMKAEEPVFDPSDGPGFYGGYGFPVEDSIRMSGQVILWGYPEQIGYGDLGEIDQTGFHATVCKLLEIETSEKASDKVLEGIE